MIDFTIDTRIDRSPTDVFDYVTDPDKLATWQTNTVSAERQDEGPLRIGSRLREVHSGPGGRSSNLWWRSPSSTRGGRSL